jgi:hypothetical protein
MTTFDERERAFERKFAHDEEMRFRAIARRNKLFGAWACERLGLSGEPAARYMQAFTTSAVQPNGSLLDRVRSELSVAGASLSEEEIENAFTRFTAQAAIEIHGLKSEGSG